MGEHTPHTRREASMLIQAGIREERRHGLDVWVGFVCIGGVEVEAAVHMSEGGARKWALRAVERMSSGQVATPNTGRRRR